jgi:hypothetical protein
VSCLKQTTDPKQADNPDPAVHKVNLTYQIKFPKLTHKIRCLARDCQSFFFLKTNLPTNRSKSHAENSRTYFPHPIERRTWKSNQNYDMKIESEDTKRTSAGGKSTTARGKSADSLTT